MLRPSALYDNNGFTLIEALVAGIISVLVIMMALTLFLMNTNQISGHFVRSLTRTQYQTVVEQISASVRQAGAIASRLPDTGRIMTPSDSILLFDLAGNIFAGYKRSGTTLLEWNGTGFVNFKAGNRNVQLLNTGTNTTFAIDTSRKNVRLNLNVVGVDGSTKDTVRSGGEVYKCRNF